LNHQPAKLNSPDPALEVCQLETPLISNSVLKMMEGKIAATIIKASGGTRFLKRVVLSITASEEGSFFFSDQPRPQELKNSTKIGWSSSWSIALPTPASYG